VQADISGPNIESLLVKKIPELSVVALSGSMDEGTWKSQVGAGFDKQERPEPTVDFVGM
jgi:hypothetical protein